MAEIVRWRALLGDDWVERPGIDRGEVRRIVDHDAVVYPASRLEVETDDSRWPLVSIFANVAAGERVRCSVRRSAYPVGDAVVRLPLAMPFLEVLRPDGSFVRLYLHETLGQILSTLDLNLTLDGGLWTPP